MVEQIEVTDQRKETNERPPTPSKYAGLGAAVAAELMIGFWFGTGVILAIGVVYRWFKLLRWGSYKKVAVNEVTTKMAEQVQLQQVTTKDLKKVEAGKRLAEYHRRKSEHLRHGEFLKGTQSNNATV